MAQAQKDAGDAAPGTDPLEGTEPFALFAQWMATAEKAEPINPNAMALATVDAHGMPNVRMVLLKNVSPKGFVFYTNSESAKGEELARQAQAALCFYWRRLKRQIRIRGFVELVSEEEADAYFATRPRDSQIGAWASRQSHPLESRFHLEKEVARYAAKFALGKVDRPPFWRGYCVCPLEIEFWRERLFRLHDRLVFRRGTAANDVWTKQRLFP
jgi:pyridoxamine 5'-phosphate oxidase